MWVSGTELGSTEPSLLLQEIFHTEKKDITLFEVDITDTGLFKYFKSVLSWF